MFYQSSWALLPSFGNLGAGLHGGWGHRCVGLLGGVISGGVWLSGLPSTHFGSFRFELVRIVLPSELEIRFVSKIGLMVETVYVLGSVSPPPAQRAPGTQCVFTGACLRSCKLLFLFWLHLCISLALGRCGGDMVSFGGTEG